MASITIAFIVGLIFGFLLNVKPEECPRVQMGYNCKGDNCDHSEGAFRS